jgi:hypothetical protein
MATAAKSIGQSGKKVYYQKCTSTEHTTRDARRIWKKTTYATSSLKLDLSPLKLDLLPGD